MTRPILFQCRPLYESSVLDELRARYGFVGEARMGHGYLLVHAELPSRALVFERQRLVDVGQLPLSKCKPIAVQDVELVFENLVKDPMPWAGLLFTQEEATSRLEVNLDGLYREMQKQIFKKCPALRALERKPENLITKQKGKILQLFLTDEGLFFSTTEPQFLTADTAGGIHRMRFDSGAPSRSYLKIEEALAILRTEPVAGSIVVDLGAAPGGWTYGFAKRGCHVTSVDNGPMKIKGEYTGTITHLRRDGLTFNPDSKYLPVDWLIADMLIPPPKALALLKKWVGQKWCKNLIVNIKLPQQNPYAGLGAVLEWLEHQGHHRLQIRQLYHDRQEVTLFGALN